MPLVDLANEVRKIPLPEILAGLGFDGQKQGKSILFKSEIHSINVTGERFYDHRMEKGGAGAISLVMHLNQSDFKSACLWLADRFGSHADKKFSFPVVPKSSSPKEPAEREIPFPEQLKIFVRRDDQRWPQARAYLTQIRRLPAETVDSLHEQGRVFASHGRNPKLLNVSFPMFTRDGERQGMFTRSTIQSEGFRQCLGSKLFSWFCTGDLKAAREVVLVEAPIDALSYHALHPKEGRVALAVNGNSLPPHVAQTLFKAGQRPILGFDLDSAGVQGIARARQTLKDAGYPADIEIHTPQNKDWNADLVAQRPLDREQLLLDELLEAGKITRPTDNEKLWKRDAESASDPRKLIRPDEKTREEIRQIEGEKYMAYLRQVYAAKNPQASSAKATERLPKPVQNQGPKFGFKP